MDPTRDLFRVWGIPIRIHPSWLVIFALVSWSLAAGGFPETHPGWSALTYRLAGAIAAGFAVVWMVAQNAAAPAAATSSSWRTRGSCLVTRHDVRAVPRERWAEVTGARAMTPAVKLTTVAPGEPVRAALERMDTAEVAQLPGGAGRGRAELGV